MTQNQIDSYKQELPGLGAKQKKIYNVLRELGPSSNQQLMDFLNMPSNQVTARVCELQDAGWIIPDGEIFNKKTGKYNTVYKALDEQLPPERRRHKPTKVTGIYIKRSDIDMIMKFKSFATLDYTVEFHGREADVCWFKAGVTAYGISFITHNETQMTFVNDGVKIVANIIG